MSSRGAEPHDHEPARQPTLAAYAPEPVLPPTASAPDWRSRQGRWVDRSLSGRHHLPCCRGLFRPVAKSNPCTIPRSKRQRPSYRSRPHTPNLWTVPGRPLSHIEAEEDPHEAGSDQRRAEKEGQPHCRQQRTLEGDKARDDVKNAEREPEQESPPGSDLKRVDDLGDTRDNHHDSEIGRA